MTPLQAERIKTKIKKIKAALAADKKRWGGFYDAVYVQLKNETNREKRRDLLEKADQLENELS